jgi:hypothetical protein
MESMIRMDGSDHDFFYFSVFSFTHPGVRYEVCICKRRLTIECSCMDCQCRKKRRKVWEDVLEMCKHSRAVIITLDEVVPGFRNACCDVAEGR